MLGVANPDPYKFSQPDLSGFGFVCSVLDNGNLSEPELIQVGHNMAVRLVKILPPLGMCLASY